MEILRMKMGTGRKVNGFFIRVLPNEALQIIESLSAQMVKHDPNSERQEFQAVDGTFFTIAVHDTLLKA